MLALVLMMAVSEPSYVRVPECWSHNGATLTEQSEGYVWNHDGKAESLYEGSVGVGSDTRVLFSEDFERGYKFRFVDDDILLDGTRYEKGCE